MGKRIVYLALLLLPIFAITVMANNYTPAVEVSRGYVEETGAEQIPVLMYHGLLLEEENTNYHNNSAVIAVAEFEKQMQYLAENDYHTVSVAEMEAFLNGEIELPEKSVMIQFDDALRSVYRYAFPIMEQYDLTGTLNVITSRTEMDYGEEWAPYRNQYMDYAMLDEASAVFEMQSHTHELHFVEDDRTSYVISKSEEVLKEDLAISREKLAKYGDVTLFAYPFGQYNEAVIEGLKESGFTMAFTIEKGYVKPGDDPFRLNRIGITPWMTLDEFIEIVSSTKEID